MTVTPEKDKIEKETIERQKKKVKKNVIKKLSKPTKPNCKKKLFDKVSEKPSDDSDDNSKTDLDGITYGDFVLVKYDTVKSTTFFVGCVEYFDHQNYVVSFLKTLLCLP